MLTVKQLTKVYPPSVVALDGVSFTVAPDLFHRRAGAERGRKDHPAPLRPATGRADAGAVWFGGATW